MTFLNKNRLEYALTSTSKSGPINLFRQLFFLISALLILGSHIEAALAADAGQQLNQIERNLDQRTPLIAPPSIIPENESVTPSKEGIQVVIKQFVFEGNTLFSSAQLEGFLKDYLNREISFEELKMAVDSLTIYYKEHGYLGVANLPKQDIGDGAVRVVITEAKFGDAKINVDPNASYRVRPEVIQNFINANNPKNQVLNLGALDRAIMITNELPGIGVTQSLIKGVQEGQVDSVLTVTNRRAYQTNISSDNYGFHSTGAVRYLANASLMSPLNIGDRFDFTYLYTAGTNYARAAYGRPVGYSGFRLGMNASALKYEVVSGAGVSYKPEGAAETLAIEASYPTIRTRTLSLTNNASLEAKHFRNISTNGVESNYLVHLFSLGNSLSHRNALTLAGETFASIDLDVGYADYSNSPTSFRDGKAAQDVDGQFTRLRWNLNNTQFFTDTISSVIKINGQLSDSNLDSSQKFYLGGASGVRAYPSGEGGGSEGLLFNLELHKELPANLTLVGFYDYGIARQYVDNINKFTGAANATTGHNAFNMKGFGASVGWRGDVGKVRSTISLVWSRRIGNNPNPQVDGTDSDGSKPGNFYWMNATFNF